MKGHPAMTAFQTPRSYGTFSGPSPRAAPLLHVTSPVDTVSLLGVSCSASCSQSANPDTALYSAGTLSAARSPNSAIKSSRAARYCSL